MVKLDSACPNKCGSQWFSVQKQRSIRKFKNSSEKLQGIPWNGSTEKAGQVGLTYLVAINY